MKPQKAFVFGVRISNDLFNQLDQCTAQKRINRNRAVVEAISNYIENDETLTAA